jgi:hypothetical protein
VRQCWTRAHLSAISAISPAGKRYVHSQDRARTAEDGAALLAHLRRAVPGRLVISWEGAPMQRSRVIPDCRANGAAPRLPADAPALHPGEGLCGHLKGVARHQGCSGTIRQVRRDLRAAVNRVRRMPRMIKGCFNGAKR